jgi:HemY protein
MIAKHIGKLRLFLQLLLFSALIVFLSLFQGKVSIEWFDYQINLPIAVLIAFILVFFGVLNLLYKILNWLMHFPEKYSNFLLKKRKNKGHQLLLDGITAIVAGQPKEAKDFVSLSRELIPDYPLTLFVEAQCAQITGDADTATQYFNRMLKDQRLMFLGLRGLVNQAKSRQNFIEAKNLLIEAHKIRPDSPWVLDEILMIDIILAKQGCFESLAKTNVPRYLTKEIWSKHQAAISWLKFQNQKDFLSDDDKIGFLEDVCNNEKSWIMPAFHLAELLIKKENFNRAQKVIVSVFKHSSHRYFYDLWKLANHKMDIMDLYQSFEKLVSNKPNGYESLFIMGKISIEAGIVGQSKHYINQLLEKNPTKEAYELMIAIEKMNPQKIGNSNIEDILQKAINANQNYKWICNACGNQPKEWNVSCCECESFDQIKWSNDYSVNKKSGNMNVIEYQIV